MSGVVYVTGPGEALDLICARHYGMGQGAGTGSGSVAAAVAQVLEANPQIAPIAHDLPRGTRLVLPVLRASAAPAEVHLWS